MCTYRLTDCMRKTVALGRYRLSAAMSSVTESGGLGCGSERNQPGQKFQKPDPTNQQPKSVSVSLDRPNL